MIRLRILSALLLAGCMACGCDEQDATEEPALLDVRATPLGCAPPPFGIDTPVLVYEVTHEPSRLTLTVDMFGVPGGAAGVALQAGHAWLERERGARDLVLHYGASREAWDAAATQAKAECGDAFATGVRLQLIGDIAAEASQEDVRLAVTTGRDAPDYSNVILAPAGGDVVFDIDEPYVFHVGEVVDHEVVGESLRATLATDPDACLRLLPWTHVTADGVLFVPYVVTADDGACEAFETPRAVATVRDTNGPVRLLSRAPGGGPGEYVAIEVAP